MVEDIDLKVLDELIQNSRQSFRGIARKLGVSTVTVMKHVKKLEKEKIIQDYSAILDYEKLGYEIDVIINVRIAHGRFGEVYDKLKNNLNILAIYDTTGDFDAALVAKFKSRRALDAFLKKLQLLQNVERTNTIFILRILEKKGLKVS